MDLVPASRSVPLRIDGRLQAAIEAIASLYADEIGEPLQHDAVRRVLSIATASYLEALEWTRSGCDLALLHDPEEAPTPLRLPHFPNDAFFAPRDDWSDAAWTAKLPKDDEPSVPVWTETVILAAAEDLALLPAMARLGMSDEQTFFEQALGYLFTLARGYVHRFLYVVAVVFKDGRKTEVRPFSLDYCFRLWAGLPLVPPPPPAAPPKLPYHA